MASLVNRVNELEWILTSPGAPHAGDGDAVLRTPAAPLGGVAVVEPTPTPMRRRPGEFPAEMSTAELEALTATTEPDRRRRGPSASPASAAGRPPGGVDGVWSRLLSPGTDYSPTLERLSAALQHDKYARTTRERGRGVGGVPRRALLLIGIPRQRLRSGGVAPASARRRGRSMPVGCWPRRATRGGPRPAGCWIKRH